MKRNRIVCPICNATEENFHVDEVVMTGVWSRFFNYSNKRFTTLTCGECGHTMFFNKSSKFSVLEMIMG